MRPRALAGVAVAAVLALTLGLTGHAGASVTGKDRGRATTPDAARTALARVEALSERRGGARGGDGREATLALRELVLHRDELTGEDRRRADALLARPTDGSSDPDGYDAGTEPQRLCTPDVCVHWVETTEDAVPLGDGNENGIPDYVDRVRTALNKVHTTYVDAGYRPPKPDGALGGDGRTDVYLADVGADGLYGYCTSDQEPAGPPYDLWAYCVLDDDYATDQFPSNTPTQNMQVTAAHEYFHAVQFGYDAFDDGWFMEATATWAEDELYDHVDDNVSYLRYGQLGNTSESRNPLDTFDRAGLGQYGNWIFFRYLTERLTASEGGMPTLVRDMWEYADAAPGAEDRVSSTAVHRTLIDRGSGFGPQYAAFADANRRPNQTYDEAAANDYPTAPLRFRSVTLTPGDRRTGWRPTVLDHLTSATAQYRPSTRMGARWRLRLHLDMANRARGSRAVVTVYKAGGGTSTSEVPLGADGNGRKTVGFSRTGVKRVELTLVNASLRTNCWTDASGPLFFTCYGDPRDDDLRQLHRAVAFR